MTPTIEQAMRCYRMIAQIERMKTGRPGVETAANALRGTANVCRAAGIELSSPVTALTRKRIDAALATFVGRGITRLSAWSYVCQLRGVFAKWCRPYYEDAGWKIPSLDLPNFRVKAPRYVRPSAEMLSRVKAWYQKLTGEHWFVATMMLEFAMRNGDVLRLRRDNCVERDGRVFLNYAPHKTKHSSGRVVKWPLHPSIWAQMQSTFNGDGLPVIDEAVFDELNGMMRGFGFTGTMGAYELRKICVGHVHQWFGAEMAVSISGDDIRTIMYYYAVPAQPNIDIIRVTDLLQVGIG